VNNHLLAYIDPGSGSLLLQMLLAAALSVSFLFRRTIAGAWERVRGVRSRGSSVPRAQDPPDRSDR
jgi:hypothetical protein